MITFSTLRKSKSHKKISFKQLLPVITIATIVLAIGLGPAAQADRFDDQINQLNQENAQRRDSQAALETQENSLAAVVASLQARISTLEGQISDNLAKSAGLKQQIAEVEAEIAEQRKVLGANIKQMYLDDEISTIEMLASSRNLSHFVDKQQYQESVQSKIKTAMERINELKQQLEAQKAETEKLLLDQQAMQGQLDAERAENNRLLNLNQEQQAAYERDIAGGNARIKDLKNQQAVENARYNVGQLQTGGTGGYPWPDVYFPNSISDPWGMYKRQCVSYTAWKVASTGRHMPYWGGIGNAKNWDDNARNAGIPVDNSPRVGDVGVSNAGQYGHVVYVEAVHDDGTITVSQYNANWTGEYSVVRRSIGGLVFIHF